MRGWGLVVVGVVVAVVVVGLLFLMLDALVIVIGALSDRIGLFRLMARSLIPEGAHPRVAFAAVLAFTAIVSGFVNLDVAVVGRVTGDGILRVKDQGKVVAEIPAKSLTDDGPRYERPYSPPGYQDMLTNLNYDALPDVKDANAALLSLLESPTIASKRWVYEQYDHMVRTNTMVRPGSNAAVVRIKGTNKAIAMTVDCNSRYCLLHPYEGARLAVAEAARNLVCSGAEPIGLTDCLNFGNPERPEIMWQFVLAIEGMKDACEHFKVPIVSGNVSFYNETNGLSIYPTPMLGMVGLIDAADKTMTASV